MKKFNNFLFLTPLLAISLFSGCASKSSKSAGTKSDKFNEMVDHYFEERLKLEPLYATSIGDHRFDDRLELNLSEEHRTKELAVVESALSEIQALTCKDLNEQDTLTCETLQEDLESTKQLLKTNVAYLMPFDQLNLFPSEFAELASGSGNVTFDKQSDYENFLKRMQVVPAYIDTMIANLKLGVKKKVTTPKLLVKKGLKQVKDLLPQDPMTSIFYKPLLKVDDVVKNKETANHLKLAYAEEIKNHLYPAYRKLIAYVEKDYLPHARTTTGILSVPGGKEAYLALVRSHTTTHLSPDEIMKTGYAEVDRILKQLKEAQKQIGYKGTLREFFHYLRTDPEIYPFTTSDEILNYYRSMQAQLMEKVPAHFRLLPKEKLEVKEVEKFKAATASESYSNGDPDGSRPGIFWVPIPDPKKYPKKDMESLFLHEAIPGHHFQISIQQELPLSRYRRFAQNNAYVEGWALYCESLGSDLGFYHDPYQWIGRLANEMHRAIRLVVDTGMHWKGWSREKAIRYSMEHEPYDEHEIVVEIERYMAWPGQALAYKLGEIKIQQLKAKAKAELGARYDDRDFHDEILKDGSLPLSVLESKVENWIKDKKKAG